jgi:acyltransferase
MIDEGAHPSTRRMTGDISDRQVWIDVAKGIGISLVVAGHTGIPPLATKYVSAFHMPLFFFLSGLLYKKRPFHQAMARRARMLLVPYFIFSLVGFILYNAVITDSWQGLSHYTRQWLGILYGTPDGPYELTVFPLWFLLSLLLAHVMFSLILHVSRGQPVRIAAFVIGLAAVGFVNGKTLRLAAPWSAASSLVGVLFLALGYACRDHTDRAASWSAWRKLGGILLLSGMVLTTTVANEPVVMAHGDYGTIALFLLGACSGIAMIVLVSMLVEQVRRLAAFTAVLTYLGRNTLIILAMHVPVAALAAHWLAHLPSLTNPALVATSGKVLAGLLLLTSIELFKRCPLLIPRSPVETQGLASLPATSLATKARGWRS